MIQKDQLMEQHIGRLKRPAGENIEQSEKHLRFTQAASKRRVKTPLKTVQQSWCKIERADRGSAASKTNLKLPVWWSWGQEE